MNNIKRGLQLGGAIAGIVVAAFLLLYPIYQVASMGIGLGFGLSEIFAILFSLPVICLLITSVASIVIHSLLCKNPAKKGKEKNYFIMTIVAIVLNVLLFVVYLAFFQWVGWAWGLISLAVAGVLAATIFLKDAKAA